LHRDDARLLMSIRRSLAMRRSSASARQRVAVPRQTRAARGHFGTGFFASRTPRPSPFTSMNTTRWPQRVIGVRLITTTFERDDKWHARERAIRTQARKNSGTHYRRCIDRNLGFGADEIGHLIVVADDDGPKTADLVPSGGQAVARLGDLFRLGRHYITDPAIVRRLMEDEVARFVFTDQTFNVAIGEPVIGTNLRNS
jgi:hypothetical protein